MSDASGTPGWRPDPLDGTRWRWWDGQAWTDHVSSPTHTFQSGSARSGTSLLRRWVGVSPERSRPENLVMIAVSLLVLVFLLSAGVELVRSVSREGGTFPTLSPTVPASESPIGPRSPSETTGFLPPRPTDPESTSEPEVVTEVLQPLTIVTDGQEARTVCGEPTTDDDQPATETPTLEPTQTPDDDGVETGPVNVGGNPRVRLETPDGGFVEVGGSLVVTASFTEPPPADRIINWSLTANSLGGTLVVEGCGATYYPASSLGTSHQGSVQVHAWASNGTKRSFLEVADAGRGVVRLVVTDPGDALDSDCGTATLDVWVGADHGVIREIAVQGIGAWTGPWAPGSTVRLTGIPPAQYTVRVAAGTQRLEMTASVGCGPNLAAFQQG